jgi:hypothetical protein
MERFRQRPNPTLQNKSLRLTSPWPGPIMLPVRKGPQVQKKPSNFPRCAPNSGPLSGHRWATAANNRWTWTKKGVYSSHTTKAEADVLMGGGRLSATVVLLRPVLARLFVVPAVVLLALVGCGGGGGSGSSGSSGTVFKLSYTLADGSKLTAVVHGTLQSDHNTLVVDSVEDFAAIDGASGPSLPQVLSYDTALDQPVSALPTLTLDGSYMDFLVCADDACNAGFGFAVGNLFGSTIGNAYAGNASFGNTFEAFNVAGYKLQAI